MSDRVHCLVSEKCGGDYRQGISQMALLADVD